MELSNSHLISKTLQSHFELITKAIVLCIWEFVILLNLNNITFKVQFTRWEKAW